MNYNLHVSFLLCQYNSIRFDLIWYDKIRWTGLPYDMIWYDMMWYDVIWYDLIWYYTVWYYMIWYDMIFYDIIQYDMIWYDMVRYYLTLYRFSCNQYKVWHSRNRIFFYYILRSECVILLHENLTKNFLQTLWRCSKEVKEILLTSFILKCLLS